MNREISHLHVRDVSDLRRKWSPDCVPALCVGSDTWRVSPRALVLLEKSPTDPVRVWTQSSARATHRIATCLKGVPADAGINYLLLPHRSLLFLLRHNWGWKGGVLHGEDVKIADSLWNYCSSQVSRFNIIIIIPKIHIFWPNFNLYIYSEPLFTLTGRAKSTGFTLTRNILQDLLEMTWKVIGRHIQSSQWDSFTASGATWQQPTGSQMSNCV